MSDYLVVGAGVFGSVFAYEMTKRGKTCTVIDKRSHIGGNCYTEGIEGINVHKYGAHIFHTNDRDIWAYINRFTDFNRYTNSPIANFCGEIYNLPFNMNTFHALWGVNTPTEAKAKIESQRLNVSEPKNLEEQALSLVGTDIYEKLIKGYTEKQWGRNCRDLPAFIIKRLPIRFTYDNNYFNDRYQGIPIGGYTRIFDRLLEKADVKLNTPFIAGQYEAGKVIYTGPIDEYYGYQLGALEYRSLMFEDEMLLSANYQGNAVVNYTAAEIPYTRIIEHKHFEFGEQSKTIITREYPTEWVLGGEPYYPINNEKNNTLYKCYLELSEDKTNIIFGGRLGCYKYADMWQIIRDALECVKKELSE